MPLSPGTSLGHYDVTALIGEGGMGQVYRATDTQLHRDVALKILPDAFAADPDRLARFQREAQVLASLNHPGIAARRSWRERTAAVLDATFACTSSLPAADELSELRHRSGTPVYPHDGLHIEIQPLQVSVKRAGASVGGWRPRK